MTAGHDKTLIKRDDFELPTRQLGWSTRSPRGAAQWTCDFRELPALDRSFSLHELFGQCLRGSWEPMEYVQNAVHALYENS